MSESAEAAAGPAASSSWTEFEPPTRIRWTELPKNRVVASQGGYDLAPAGDGTRLTVFKGRGVGVLIAGFALRPTPRSAALRVKFHGRRGGSARSRCFSP